MPNKLLKELQAKFKTAERESKAPEEERREKIQPDFMETNEDSKETIGMPPTLATQNSIHISPFNSNEFRNLFDSITRNNMKNIGAYRNALEQEAQREQLAFGTIKEEARFARRKNAYKQRNSYHKNDDLVEKAIAFKREIQEDNHGSITGTTVVEGSTIKTTEAKKYYCRHKGKKMEPGEIRLSISDCEIWVCRNDTLRYGHLFISKCETVDYRAFQNFHDACIEHNCEVYEVNTDEPIHVGLEPGFLRTEKNDNNTLWTAAFY